MPVAAHILDEHTRLGIIVSLGAKTWRTRIHHRKNPTSAFARRSSRHSAHGIAHLRLAHSIQDAAGLLRAHHRRAKPVTLMGTDGLLVAAIYLLARLAVRTARRAGQTQLKAPNELRWLIRNQELLGRIRGC